MSSNKGFIILVNTLAALLTSLGTRVYIELIVILEVLGCNKSSIASVLTWHTYAALYVLMLSFVFLIIFLAVV